MVFATFNMKMDSEGGLIRCALRSPHNFIPLDFAAWDTDFFIFLS